MKQGKDNSPSNGQSGEKSAKLFTLASPAKKTASGKNTATATNPSKNGSASEGKRLSDRANGNSASDKMPVPKLRQTTDRTAAALQRLKIKPEHLAAVPEITEFFKHAEGGLKAVLSAMRFWSQDEVIAAFLKKYDSLPEGDRARLPWEAIGLAAKLDVRTLSGAIMNAIVKSCGSTSKMLAFSSHPKLLKATIRYGQRPSGEKDRRAVDLMVGALASPKGPTFIGKAIFGGPDVKDAENAEATRVFNVGDDPNELFPDSSAMQERLVPIRQRRLTD